MLVGSPSYVNFFVHMMMSSNSETMRTTIISEKKLPLLENTTPSPNLMNPDYLHPELFPKNFSPDLTNPDHQLAKKAPIIATEIDFAGENLGEFNLPVSTQIANENSQNIQSSFFDLLDAVVLEDYCWSVFMLLTAEITFFV